MSNFKSFSLPGDSTLRIKTDEIIATVSSNEGHNVDIYVRGLDRPYHVQTTIHTPEELINYIWDIKEEKVE